MKAIFLAATALIAMLAFGGGQLLRADTIVQIGTQHWASGTVLGPGVFDTTDSGQPVPFNEEDGSNGASNFNESWTFGYTAPPTITGATLTIGIFDSPWEGKTGNTTPANTDQVASFTLDGTTSLAVLLNTEIDTVGTGINTYEVDTITIPAGDLSLLSSGSAKFSLALQGPGNSLFGPSSDLAAGLDFSTLDMMTSVTPPPPTATPEPASGLLLLGGLALIGVIFKRRVALGR
ncbi:MAG: PEP-CTERM sorting domain-containing protein [Terriglobia bacterium]